MPTTQQLATEFGNVLRQWLPPEEVHDVNTRNMSEPDSSVCHSHDFCDANMAMTQAWQNLTGAEFDPMNDADSATFNAAWRIAKADGFGLGEIDLSTLPDFTRSPVCRLARRKAWQEAHQCES